MQYRSLGNSGLQVSEIALGSWLNTGDWVAEKTSIALVHQAFVAGINLFDTADIYADGAAEVTLGKALKELPRQQVVVATKCHRPVWPGPMGGGLSRKHIVEACEASLRRLDVDYIDLYQAHAPDPETPIEETMEAFDLLVRQGKVLYIGCSNFSGKELGAAHKAAKSQGGARFISSQPRYNIFARAPEEELFPACQKLGVGNIIYSPLAHGVLTGKYKPGVLPQGSRLARWDRESPYLTDGNLALVEQLSALAEKFEMTMAQLALRWCLRREEVSSVIVGATRPDQLDETLAAGHQSLSPDQNEALDRILA